MARHLSKPCAGRPSAPRAPRRPLGCNWSSCRTRSGRPRPRDPSGKRRSRRCGRSARSCARRKPRACRMGCRMRMPPAHKSASFPRCRKNKPASWSPSKEGTDQRDIARGKCATRMPAPYHTWSRTSTCPARHTSSSRSARGRSGTAREAQSQRKAGTGRDDTMQGKDGSNLCPSRKLLRSCAPANEGSVQAPRPWCKSNCTSATLRDGSSGIPGMAMPRPACCRCYRTTGGPTGGCTSSGILPSTCRNSRWELPWIRC